MLFRTNILIVPVSSILIIRNDINTSDGLYRESSISTSYNDVKNKIVKLNIRIQESDDLKYYIDSSFADKEIIKKSPNIKKTNEYYAVQINGIDLKKVFINENEVFDDVIAKVYTGNKYISKIIINYNSNNKIVKNYTVSYEFNDYNKLTGITIPNYVTNETHNNIIDESQYNTLKIKVNCFIDNIEKLILLQELSDSSKKIIDENNNIILDNINIKEKPARTDLKYSENRLSGTLIWDGFSFDILDSKIVSN